MPLHLNDDVESGVDLNSRITVSLNSGNYTAEATTYNVGQTGSFSLNISGLAVADTTR